MSWLSTVYDTIPLKWKLLGLAVGLLTYTAIIGGSFAYIGSSMKELGALEERDKNKDAVNAALEEVIKDRDLAYQKLQELEEEIYNAPETDDGPLAPVLSRTLDQRVR